MGPVTDLKQKSAAAIAIWRRPFGYGSRLAILLAVSACAARAQSNGGSVFNGQTVAAPPRQGPASGLDAGADPFAGIEAEHRMKLLNSERHKKLISDSDKLIKLATELNNEISHSNPGSLTSEQLRKVAEIEKLARSIREKMTQTVAAPNANFLPIYGPPYN